MKSLKIPSGCKGSNYCEIELKSKACSVEMMRSMWFKPVWMRIFWWMLGTKWVWTPLDFIIRTKIV